MIRRGGLVASLLLAVLVVAAVVEVLGPGVVDPERDLVVTLVTAAALLIVAAAFDPTHGPHPLLGSLLASVLVLFPPLDAGLIAGAVIAIGAFRVPEGRRCHPLVESGVALVLTVLVAFCIQLVLGGPLLTTGLFPGPGQGLMPGLLVPMALGAVWWLAVVTINRLLGPVVSERATPIVLVGNGSVWTVLLAAAGIGFATGFWSVLATIATNVVVGATALAASAVLLSVAHTLERRRLVAERDEARRLSELRQAHLVEAVSRADQALVDLFAGIHDGPLQEFSAAAAYADLASEERDADARWIRQRDLLRHGVSDLRALLRREVLLDASTFSTLEDAIAHVQRITAGGLPADITVEASPEAWESLGPEARMALTLVAQEALLNTAKHAQAGSIDVRLERTPTAIVLTITDDGCGFVDDDSRAPTGEVHLGQTLMGLRMGRIAGTIEVDTAPGHGTTVEATVPLGGAAKAPS